MEIHVNSYFEAGCCDELTTKSFCVSLSLAFELASAATACGGDRSGDERLGARRFRRVGSAVAQAGNRGADSEHIRGEHDSGADQRERLALVAAIDAEIGVKGEDRSFGPEFGHTDEAGVGEGHGDAGVADHEFVQ